MPLKFDAKNMANGILTVILSLKMSNLLFKLCLPSISFWKDFFLIFESSQ